MYQPLFKKKGIHFKSTICWFDYSFFFPDDVVKPSVLVAMTFYV